MEKTTKLWGWRNREIVALSTLQVIRFILELLQGNERGWKVVTALSSSQINSTNQQRHVITQLMYDR
jgi:hypothetical protein